MRCQVKSYNERNPYAQLPAGKAGDSGGTAVDTGRLEYGRRRRNVSCSGEMLRYATEHRSRRQLARLELTLRHESVGIKQD